MHISASALLAAVLGAAVCTAKFSSPAAGDVLVVNQELQISWETQGLAAPLDLNLVPASTTDLTVVAQEIAVRVDNTGTLNWTPDTTITAFESFAMVIRDSSGNTVVSESFTISQLTVAPVLSTITAGAGAGVAAETPQVVSVPGAPIKVFYSGTSKLDALLTQTTAEGAAETAAAGKEEEQGVERGELQELLPLPTGGEPPAAGTELQELPGLKKGPPTEAGAAEEAVSASNPQLEASVPAAVPEAVEASASAALPGLGQVSASAAIPELAPANTAEGLQELAPVSTSATVPELGQASASAAIPELGQVTASASIPQLAAGTAIEPAESSSASVSVPALGEGAEAGNAGAVLQPLGDAEPTAVALSSSPAAEAEVPLLTPAPSAAAPAFPLSNGTNIAASGVAAAGSGAVEEGGSTQPAETGLAQLPGAEASASGAIEEGDASGPSPTDLAELPEGSTGAPEAASTSLAAVPEGEASGTADSEAGESQDTGLQALPGASEAGNESASASGDLTALPTAGAGAGAETSSSSSSSSDEGSGSLEPLAGPGSAVAAQSASASSSGAAALDAPPSTLAQAVVPTATTMSLAIASAQAALGSNATSANSTLGGAGSVGPADASGAGRAAAPAAVAAGGGFVALLALFAL